MTNKIKKFLYILVHLIPDGRDEIPTFALYHPLLAVVMMIMMMLMMILMVMMMMTHPAAATECVLGTPCLQVWVEALTGAGGG